MGAALGWSKARRLITWAATLVALAAGAAGRAWLPLRRCKSGSALHSRAGADVAAEAVALATGSRWSVAVGSSGTIGERCTRGGMLVLVVLLVLDVSSPT